jgi:hypothetical protein
MNEANATGIPAKPHTILTQNNLGENNSSNVYYHEAVGSLMFLSIVLRPNIAYSVNSVSKYLNNHNERH